jgi:hypothetical protein
MTPLFYIPCSLEVGTYENFIEFRYNIDEGTVVFRCSLFFVHNPLPNLNKSMPSRPIEVALSLQPRMYAVMLSLVLHIMQTSQGGFFKD